MKGPLASPRLALALSLLAVAISTLAWHESDTARFNTEKKDRAELDVISARILPAESTDGVRTIELGIVNRGHGTATDVGYWKGLEIIYARNPSKLRPTPKYFERPPHLPLTMFRMVLKGGSKAPLTFTAPFDQRSAPMSLSDALVYVYGEMKYVDRNSGWTFTAPWCFSITAGQTGVCDLSIVM